MNHEKEDWINGEKTEDVVAFLDRLYTAKREVEQRIVVLGGEDESTGHPSPRRQPGPQESSSKLRLTLRDVLRNPSSLSYFMEFMDRRHHSLLVQFWLTVESFKNPLESVDSGSSGEEDEPIQDQSSSTNIKEDVLMIHELYFSAKSPSPVLSCISRKHVDVIQSFARNEAPSPKIQRQARRSVMLSQRRVEQEMEHDYEDFERSELWFRVVGDVEHSRAGTQVPEPPPERPRLASSGSVSPPTSTHKQVRIAAPQFIRGESTVSLPSLVQRADSPKLNSGRSSPALPPATSSRIPSTRNISSNIDVLMSPSLIDLSEHSRAPLFDEPDESLPQTADEAERMEAIQAALTDIMAGAEDVDPTENQDVSFDDKLMRDAGKGRNVFDEVNDNEGEDEDEDRVDVSNGDEPGTFQLATPGDLQLSYEIVRLGSKISDLESQDIMLDTLIKKAELTGDNQELKLLQRSKSSMSRELRELQFQKAQYEQQESANRLLSDRTKVTIVSSAVGEEDGKSVVRYLTQVQQLAPDGNFASGWVVARRYNEFLSMHNKLREQYTMVRNLDFPGKRLVTALSGSFVDTRKTALEKYMQVSA